MSARPALLAALLLLPLGASAQTEEGERKSRARVSRSDGKALIKRPGDEDWKPLDPRAVLKTGDRVQAKGKDLELVVPSDPAALADATHNAHNRVVLAPGAEITVAPPGQGVDLRLEAGEVFAVARDALRVQANKSKLTVRAGDAQIERSRSGAVEVVVHSGEVDVEGPDGKQTLGARSHLSVNARGEVLRTRTVKRLKPPKFTRPRIAQVLFLLDARTFPQRTFDQSQVALLEGDKHLTAVTPVWPDPNSPGNWTRHVHLERYSKGGLFNWDPRARVRVRYRLTAPAPLGLVLRPRHAASEERSVDKNFEHRLQSPRAGVWSEVEFVPAAFPEADMLAKPTEPQQIHLLTLLSGLEGESGPFELHVDRILVYVPAS